jgi:hypothetical protein
MKNQEIKVVTVADAKKLIQIDKKNRIDYVLKRIGEQASKGRNQVHIGQTEQKQYVFDALKRKGFKIDGTLVKW